MLIVQQIIVLQAQLSAMEAWPEQAPGDWSAQAIAAERSHRLAAAQADGHRGRLRPFVTTLVIKSCGLGNPGPRSFPCLQSVDRQAMQLRIFGAKDATIAAKVALEASITAMSDNGGEEVEATAEGQLVRETLQEDHDNSPEGSEGQLVQETLQDDHDNSPEGRGEATAEVLGVATGCSCSPADVAKSPCNVASSQH